MSEVSNADIYNVLINMRGDIGRLEGKVDSHSDTLTAHMADDKINEAALITSLQKLQSTHDRQKGFIAAITTVGGLIGAGIGVAADYISRGHH
jgi:hypothetical protein